MSKELSQDDKRMMTEVFASHLLEPSRQKEFMDKTCNGDAKMMALTELIQEQLIKNGTLKKEDIKEPGLFDEKTLEGLKKFIYEHKKQIESLKLELRVGAQIFNDEERKLAEKIEKFTPEKIEDSVKNPDKNKDEILAVEKGLAKAGLLRPEAADGKYTKETEIAIESFIVTNNPKFNEYLKGYEADINTIKKPKPTPVVTPTDSTKTKTRD